MNYILFDDASRDNLLPLTFIRPIADIRIGILTIREKWEKYLKANTSSLTEQYLSAKYPLIKEDNNILINGSVCPNPGLVKQVLKLKINQALVCKDYIIALNIATDEKGEVDISNSDMIEDIVTDIEHIKISNLWDIFHKNDSALREDYLLLTAGRKSHKISPTNHIFSGENIFIEKGAKIECSVINATDGPVYIGKDTEIMEGSLIRGPFALCDNSVVKMGAKIYGATTVGPYSKVGGELNNVVIFGYSNKAHDGFIGNSVIGEWCNLGADTNCSNLKNTYDEVKLWNYPNKHFISSGLQFCGLIMGDHSKCGINTMFNTGTVVGVNANIYGSGFLRNFVPSFAWGGGPNPFGVYDLDKSIRVAEMVTKRRNYTFSEEDKKIHKHIYYLTAEFRQL